MREKNENQSGKAIENSKEEGTEGTFELTDEEARRISSGWSPGPPIPSLPNAPIEQGES